MDQKMAFYMFYQSVTEASTKLDHRPSDEVRS